MDQKNHDSITEKEPEESFESLLNRSVVPSFHLNPGEMIETVVIKITKEWVFIDSGGKLEGHIVIDEFKDDKGNITIKEGIGYAPISCPPETMKGSLPRGSR